MINPAWLIYPSGKIEKVKISISFALRRMSGKGVVPPGGLSSLAALNNVCIAEIRRFNPVGSITLKNKLLLTVPMSVARRDLGGAAALIDFCYLLEKQYSTGNLMTETKFVRVVGGAQSVIEVTQDTAVRFFELRMATKRRR